MTLAPYYVPWALSTCALLLMGLGLCWLVFHGVSARLMGVLWLSDGVAGWLAFAAVYHSLFSLTGPSRGLLAGGPALGVLWGTVAAYLALRLLPTRLRSQTLLLGLSLAAWGWTIGAGYQFLGQMEERAALLKERPGEVLGGDSPRLAPLRHALTLTRLEQAQQQRTAELIADLEAGRPLGAGRLAGARYVLIPELLGHYRRDLLKLRTYQVLQIVLLAALLLAWGFGRRPDPASARPAS